MYSLSAAALAQSIAKGCSAGHSSKCNCGQTPTEPPPGQFKWGGCGDDVRFGVIFSKWFTDAAINKKKMTKNALMNMHNNAVGRKVYNQQHLSILHDSSEMALANFIDI